MRGDGMRQDLVDGLPVATNLRVDVWHMDGGNPVLLRSEREHNLCTLTGRNLLRDLLHWNSTGDGTQPSGLNRFAVGTSTAAFAAASSQLGAETFRDSFTQRTKTDGQTVYKYFLGAASGNGVTLTEAGLFGNGASTAANNGTMYAGAIYTGIAKTTSIGVTYTWTLTWADDGV